VRFGSSYTYNSLYISPTFRKALSTVQDPTTQFYYCESLLQAQINTPDHYFACSTLRRLLKYSQASHDPELVGCHPNPTDLQTSLIQTQEIPMFKISSATVVPAYIMGRWAAHYLFKTVSISLTR
jgi:hypothetical protein